jgi:hypothetical protein
LDFLDFLDLDLDGNGNNFLDLDLDGDFLDLDGDFLDRNSDLKLLSHGILVLFGGFMTRTVALVIPTGTGPFASTSGEGAHGNRTTGNRTTGRRRRGRHW